jgi:hypothetical protein
MRHKLSIDEYLQNVARFAGSDYGKLVREQFSDNSGDMELAMLVAPSAEELEEFKRAIAIMTPEEKAGCESLTDEQVQRIAADAHVDPANLAIFINGYILHCKRVS